MPQTIESRPPRRLLPSLLSLVSLASLILPPALTAAPALELTAGAVTASGVTPEGCTVFFSVAHERLPWLRRVVTRAEPRMDLDGDGEVAFIPDGEVADTSVWAAINVTDGAYAISAPVGFELVEEAIDWRVSTALAGTLADQRQDLQLVVIRPGTAAWHGRVFDGASGDSGAAEDGAVELRLADLTPIWPPVERGTVAPLVQLENGDVVVGIDPALLVSWSFVFGAPAQPTGSGQ